MKRIVIAAIASLWATGAAGDSIGLFTDATGTECSTTLASGAATDILIRLDSRGAVDAGEFRIMGLPPGWTARIRLFDATQRISIVGIPTAEGTRFLQSPHEGPQGLFYLMVEATTDAHDVILEVTPHLDRTPRTCAWVHHPDENAVVCVEGGRFVINGSGDCHVSVRAETWTRARQLFR